MSSKIFLYKNKSATYCPPLCKFETLPDAHNILLNRHAVLFFLINEEPDSYVLKVIDECFKAMVIVDTTTQDKYAEQFGSNWAGKAHKVSFDEQVLQEIVLWQHNIETALACLRITFRHVVERRDGKSFKKMCRRCGYDAIKTATINNMYVPPKWKFWKSIKMPPVGQILSVAYLNF